MKILARYCGPLLDMRDQPCGELWTILEPLGDYTAGSTLSRRTIETFGILVPVSL